MPLGATARSGVMPKVRSSGARRRGSGLPSTAASSFVTHSGGRPSTSSGRQRRQGRYPAKSASFTVPKNSTFRRAAGATLDSRKDAWSTAVKTPS
jgi:hypothetical protein